MHGKQLHERLIICGDAKDAMRGGGGGATTGSAINASSFALNSSGFTSRRRRPSSICGISKRRCVSSRRKLFFVMAL